MRIITTFLVLIVVVSQFSSPNKADATGLPVVDVAHTGISVAGWIAEAGRFLSKLALDTALQALKKRLLDTMTDQIVNWINGGGNPKFTTNFGSVFTDAADAAVGDVLQQYAETQALCQPFAFNIQLQLQKPPTLSQQTTCSLTQVISNFQAYRNNFANGGWLGYQELLKPQNNQWGVEIITQNEILNRTAQKTNTNVLKQQINVGFNSEQCTGGWDLINTQNGEKVKPDVASSIGLLAHDGDTSLAPDNPPVISAQTMIDYTVKYVCAGSTVTTPGRALAAGLEKSLYSGLDLVINSQDLSNALAVIADAAFNKLISAGVRGVQDMLKPGNPPTQTTGISGSQEYGDYRGTQNQVAIQAADSIRSTYLSQLNPARDTLSSASTTLATASSTNQNVIKNASDLLLCLGGNTSEDAIFAGNATQDANGTFQIITGKSAEWRVASSSITSLIGRIAPMAPLTCDMACLSQISQQSVTNAVSIATGLSVDANNILLNVQTVLTEVQKRKTLACHI